MCLLDHHTIWIKNRMAHFQYKYHAWKSALRLSIYNLLMVLDSFVNNKLFHHSRWSASARTIFYFISFDRLQSKGIGIGIVKLPNKNQNKRPKHSIRNLPTKFLLSLLPVRSERCTGPNDVWHKQTMKNWMWMS